MSDDNAFSLLSAIAQFATPKTRLFQTASLSGADDVTVRDEANAITLQTLRNGYLEDLHAGRTSPLLADASLSRMTNAEMKKLMIETSARLANWLFLRDRMLAAQPEDYVSFIRAMKLRFTHGWEREKMSAKVGPGALQLARCTCKTILDEAWNYCPQCGRKAK